MQLSKFLQEKNEVLTMIDRKMIFKIDDNFFIDDEGIKSFTEKKPCNLSITIFWKKKTKQTF